MTAYKIRQNSDQGVVIAGGDTLTLNAGVSVIDPSVNMNSRQGLDVFAGIQDSDAGANHVSVLGTAEGFIGAWFWLGSDSVTVGDGGHLYGYNAGAEFHDGGQNVLTIRDGGTVDSQLYGVWFGAFPHDDYTTLPDSGSDTIHNAGLIEGERRDAVRMVLGGNHIVNTGAIQSNFEDAIHFDSGLDDPRNVVSNSGHIVAGPHGAAIVSGDAAMTVANSGTIAGDIQFGAGADRFSGAGSVSGTIFGGDGADRLIGGTGDVSLCGGAGADVLEGGTGATTFVYTAVSDSAVGSLDSILGFDFAKDHIEIGGVDLTGFAHLARPHDLAVGGAGLLAGAGGTSYLVVDANGVAGYQAGADFEIKLVHPLDTPR
jgi:Ca2+-binding RTX toxin-like protein